jgi:hypothetical protein
MDKRSKSKGDGGVPASIAPTHELTLEEEEKMREAEDSLNDDDLEEEDDRSELLGYYCIGCGRSQQRRGWGCDRCGGSLDEWYA